MGWTEEDLKRIEEALATGALTVKHGDKLVTYRSIQDLLALHERIRRYLENRKGQAIRRSYLSLGTGTED